MKWFDYVVLTLVVVAIAVTGFYVWVTLAGLPPEAPGAW